MIKNKYYAMNKNMEWTKWKKFKTILQSKIFLVLSNRTILKDIESEILKKKKKNYKNTLYILYRWYLYH